LQPRARILQRLLALAARVCLNHWLVPTRALADYTGIATVESVI
jgi:hypothetical protein